MTAETMVERFLRSTLGQTMGFPGGECGRGDAEEVNASEGYSSLEGSGGVGVHRQ